MELAVALVVGHELQHGDEVVGEDERQHGLAIEMCPNQKRFLWLGAVRFAAFCSIKNAERSRILKAQGWCCSFWPKLSK